MTHLRSNRRKIILTKAFLASDLSNPGVAGNFKRGVTTLSNTPEKYMKPFLAFAYGWKEEVVANIPGIKDSIKTAFIWSTKQAGNWAWLEKEMDVDRAKNIYRDL
eukprot:3332219-Lingulodinium_polyedra.AAC.1